MSVMTCQSCGAPLDAITADALCPACVLRMVLEAVPADGGGTVAVPTHLALPRMFGPYELIKEIGRGGMGVVYAAWQPALGRTVAVKLLLAGAYASEPALRRFQLEAAAAAKLQHPNIVAIHDYGEVDGQPYYAMDLVTGRNLAEHCAGRPLPVRRAAEFLRLLAGAVHYAHQCGILHRDLKPSNVLVDEQDRPRITDFGLAKLLGSTEGGTLTGQMLGSPSYAATEQVAGRDAAITAASDVYGLGALFYHLVTGRAPFNAATPAETVRLVLDTDPAPPRLLNPGLPRDLETICLKCLAKEPARRYTTAADVAEDVERFLSEQPIRARPPNAFYQMGKFARRHRAGVVATGVTLVALAVGLTMALVGYRRAVVQRRATEAARFQAEGLVELMANDLTPTLEQRGGQPQLLKTIEATVHYFESLPSELRNTKTDRAHADALASLARLRRLSLNDNKGAEEALREALTLREKIARENPDDPEAAAEWLWAECEPLWAPADWHWRHTYERIAEFYRRWKELHARFPDNLRVQRGLAEVASAFAFEAASFDKPKEALAAALESRALVEELVAARPDDKSLVDLVQKSLCGLSSAYRDPAEAAAAAEQALAYCSDALKADPANLNLRRYVAEAARWLSYRAIPLKRIRDAELIAREQYRILLEANPGDQDVQVLYAMAHMKERNYLFFVDGDRTAARDEIRKFDALLGALPERNAEIDTAEWREANSRLLARLAALGGNLDEARANLQQARTRFAIYFNRLPAGSFERRLARVRHLQDLEWIAWDMRDWPELGRLAQETVDEIEAGLREQPANEELLLRQAMTRCFHGMALQGAGQTAEAVIVLQEAVSRLQEIPETYWVYDVEDVRNVANLTLVKALAQSGDLVRARALGDSILATFGTVEPEGWGQKEWCARVNVVVAELLGPKETARRMALLERAHEILTRPEAEGRLTVFGREDLATIARLRAATATPTR